MKEYDDIFLKNGLKNLGVFYPQKEDEYLSGIKTVVLLGPDEPKFWSVFSASHEFTDCLANPLDRWSLRVVGSIAKELLAESYFPFDKKEKYPFVSWALKTGEAFVSPVHLLVHRKSGLFVSYRGALGFKKKIAFNTQSGVSPCRTCPRPCLSSCPASAINADQYNYSLCTKFLEKSEKVECHYGCLVRRSCPVGQEKRLIEQSEFHMAAFLKGLNSEDVRHKELD